MSVSNVYAVEGEISYMFRKNCRPLRVLSEVLDQCVCIRNQLLAKLQSKFRPRFRDRSCRATFQLPSRNSCVRRGHLVVQVTCKPFCCFVLVVILVEFLKNYAPWSARATRSLATRNRGIPILRCRAFSSCAARMSSYALRSTSRAKSPDGGMNSSYAYDVVQWS
jgi:hypothetical protein